MTSVGPDLTKRDAVAELLRNEILSGSLAPGIPVQQDDIARLVGVSATPVREALSVLESEGLLERRAHRGFVVADGRFHDMAEVYEIRALLEARAARIAARRRPPLDGIVAAMNEAAGALGVPDIHRFRQANLRFHTELVRASGSRTLVGLVSTLQARSTYFLRLDAPRMRRIHRDHLRIVELIRRGDAGTVSDLVERHINAYSTLVPMTQHDPRGRE